MNLDLNFNFARNDVKKWFNDNYFIGLYDLNDNLITVFDELGALTKFLNKPLNLIIYRLKTSGLIEYNSHKVKMYIFEKDKEEDYFEERGKSLC